MPARRKPLGLKRVNSPPAPEPVTVTEEETREANLSDDLSGDECTASGALASSMINCEKISGTDYLYSLKKWRNRAMVVQYCTIT